MKAYNENTTKTKSYKGFKDGYFGEYGGRFVPDILGNKLEHLSEVFMKFRSDPEFDAEYKYYLQHYVGRPSPLYFARNLSGYTGSKIYLKREDLNHTGAHKINNAIGQILLAKRMGATEIIAETGLICRSEIRQGPACFLIVQ